MFFSRDGFRTGKWAKELKGQLPQPIHKDWKSIIRVLRGKWVQWIQFERRDWPKEGPRYRWAKPAILALDDQWLNVGLYVERGYDRANLPRDPLAGWQEYSQDWDWHALMERWSSPAGREAFHRHVVFLRDPVAMLQASNPYETFPLILIPLVTPDSYSEVLREVEPIPFSCWVALIIGVRIPWETCHQAAKVVPELCWNPLVQAVEMCATLSEGTPETRA